MVALYRNVPVQVSLYGQIIILENFAFRVLTKSQKSYHSSQSGHDITTCTQGLDWSLFLHKGCKAFFTELSRVKCQNSKRFVRVHFGLKFSSFFCATFESSCNLVFAWWLGSRVSRPKNRLELLSIVIQKNELNFEPKWNLTNIYITWLIP